MASTKPFEGTRSMYPEVIESKPEASAPSLPNPNPNSSPPSSSSNLYPSIDPSDFAQNLIPYDYTPGAPSAPPLPHEDDLSAPPLVHDEEAFPASGDVLLKIPGVVLNLIDQQYSVMLASGDFTVIRLCQGGSAVAVLARVANKIQWSLAKETAAVKVDDSHYFFSFFFPDQCDEGEVRKGDVTSYVLSYGLTIASKGQEALLKELDALLKSYSNFSVHEVSENAKKKGEALDTSVAKEMSPADLSSGEKKELMEGTCAAYWTTIAPNVDDYSGAAARLIAQGSGHLIKGILWCGDVTAERLKVGNEVLKTKMAPGENTEVSPETLKRIKRVKAVTKMTEKVASGLLSGVVKVSGLFASSMAKTKTGKKIIKLIPEEVLLASLDGFAKVCDAVEVSGKHVMSTTSTVTTDLVNHRFKEFKVTLEFQAFASYIKRMYSVPSKT
ncbi:protein EARLY-RESPONSIVE TO DEHYDRATION 7, chloroplastic-like isoform X2 [Prosopis cineraria]|uniref:protein EARLY-RESPONSIVE TO DEHYDRATION 7, chloroplastic-like isoform X2 n=1 Tax=Prosopis cineraria TaxID=364024 RepID=UPI00240FD466|nr:protein EARLY-RESPONSIVE TO DEHYDRATION 7, chloroplastic-like isoform X2 [Prosopis cineraria]